MDSSVPIITKVGFFDSHAGKMKAKVPKRHFSSLSYRTCGSVLIESADTSFVSHVNTLTFVPAGCDYHTEIYENTEYVILHYRIAPTSRDFFDRPVLFTPENKDVFFNLFLQGIRHTRAGRDYACMADAYRLFSELEKACWEKKPPERLAQVKQYMDENLVFSNLSVSDLAVMHQTSEAYFRREFKKYYDASPIEYIKKRRIETACRLLRTELYTIAEVATHSGFDSVSYFSSEFRRIMGCSPREYRNM